MKLSGDEFYDDDVTSGLADDRQCVVCDAPLDWNDRNPCDDCTNLGTCVDDICHGLGYCMHRSDSWIP